MRRLCEGIYLVLVCALIELFELVVEHSELPGDALYPSMQAPVLTVLGVEIVFIPLTLIWRADHRVLPGRERTDNVLAKMFMKDSSGIWLK